MELKPKFGLIALPNPQVTGWPKDYDMTAVLTSDQRAKVAETRTKEDASNDNGNLHSQIEYLAKAYTQLEEIALRRAVKHVDTARAEQSHSRQE